jgi:hypothetical protein
VAQTRGITARVEMVRRVTRDVMQPTDIKMMNAKRGIPTFSYWTVETPIVLRLLLIIINAYSHLSGLNCAPWCHIGYVHSVTLLKTESGRRKTKHY